MPIIPRHSISLPRNDLAHQFKSGASHPRWRTNDQLFAELTKCPLGTLTLTGDIEIRERSRRYCAAYCSVCDDTRWILVDSILRGLTKGCMCQRNRKYPMNSPSKSLGARYDAMVQRCERDTHVSSRHYKGRGIKVLFESRQHFIEWALARWPTENFRYLDFDRIDNDGHYSPENLRLVTRTVNLLNKRRRA